MLKTGEWLSVAVIGLVILFIFLSTSFFSFLIGPNASGPRTTIEPSSSFIQIVFISIGPAIAISFFTTTFSKDLSKLSSLFVLFSGIILILGMIYDLSLLPKIPSSVFFPDWILYVPYIFMGFGVLLVVIGVINHKKSRNQKPRRSFEIEE